jgi:Flp pilus assembly protein TadD
VSVLGAAEALTAAGRLDEARAALSAHLRAAPADADGHAALGRVALRQGDAAAAADAFARAAELVPGHAAHHANLAGALRRLGEHGAAAAALDRAVALDPARAELRFNRANLLRARGRTASALSGYFGARALAPALAAVASNLGGLLRMIGRLEAAASHLAHATLLEPALAEAWVNRATVLVDLARPDEAWAVANHALAHIPGHARIHLVRGLAEAERGQLDAARADFAASLAIAPALAETAYHLALVCRRMGDELGAAAALARALAALPDHGGAHQTLAALAADAGALDHAAVHAGHAFALSPDDAGAAAGFGAVLVSQGRLDAADKAFCRARALDPAGTAGLANHALLEALCGRPGKAAMLAARFRALAPASAEAHFTSGALERRRARTADALAHFDNALRLAAGHATYRHARAAVLLSRGCSLTGLIEYRHRWRVHGRPDLGGFPQRSFPQPEWGGELLGERGLVVWGEQGLGDELWQSGYVGGLRGVGGRVVVECDPRLAGVVGRSYGWAEVCARMVEPCRSARLADVQCAMGDLALRLGLADRSAPVGYLVGDGVRIAGLRRRYRSEGAGPKGAGPKGAGPKGAGPKGAGPVVGISWRSVKPRRERSFEAPLTAWGPVLSVRGVTFVGLQYGDVGAELRAAGARWGARVVHDEGIDGRLDVEGFLAQVAAVDVVVSIANATVSAAHGVGRECFAALKVSQDDWRFREASAVTPWLPLVRQYWQAQEGAWAEVFERIAADLRAWCAARAEPGRE